MPPEDQPQQQSSVHNQPPVTTQDRNSLHSLDTPDAGTHTTLNTSRDPEHPNSSPCTARQTVPSTPQQALEIMESPLLSPSEDEASSRDDDQTNGTTGHLNNQNHHRTPADTDVPSNERLLGTAFVSFMGFAIVQTVFAFIAGSQAMLGDSAAMMVDALTYGFNYFAERQKNRDDDDDATTTMSRRLRARLRRKRTLIWELIPPLISVVTLVIVTAFVLRQAVKVLVLDAHRPKDQQHIPNVELMLAFSLLNLALDGLNVFCFAKAKHLMGYATVETSIAPHHEPLEALPTLNVPSEELVVSRIANHRTAENHGDDDSCGEESDQYHDDDGTNLNMCSAYTHVFADTLRSFAVILAAGIALIVDPVTPEVADAAAAVVVSGLILLSIVPLAQGLVRTASELSALVAEEKKRGTDEPWTEGVACRGEVV